MGREDRGKRSREKKRKEEHSIGFLYDIYHGGGLLLALAYQFKVFITRKEIYRVKIESFYIFGYDVLR